MQVYIRVKAAGKRRDVLEKRPHALPNDIRSVNDLISCIVKENVRLYNGKPTDASVLPYLTEAAYAQGEHIGKISFGDRKNENIQDEAKAVANALQCFQDGIYRVLVNETELQDGDVLTLTENDTITFIRLVMLAGRRW